MEATPTARESLVRLEHSKITTADALAFYDTLAPTTLSCLSGRWRGASLQTGHPIDGLLEKFGWYGKEFNSEENVHPLLFERRSGDTLSLNPLFMPIGLLMHHPKLLHQRAASTLFKLLLPLLRTHRHKARLRMMEYRGVISATMVYDDLPIIDTFRRVDDDTLVGLMDLRGMNQAFFFILRRCR
ncbi:hypothetical protein DK870_29190 [Pseudomonas sp. Q1]|nr:hypothetical protein [Pseudomonas sp. Q1]